MELGALDPNDFTDAAQAEMDKRLFVKFEMRPWKDKQRSIEAGRPIFVDREYIDIRTPGTRDSVCRPARERDKQRFAAHYQAFRNRVAMPTEGTPLAEWPHVQRSTVEELAFLNIKTVEDLAHVADGAGVNFKGLLNLKRQAAEWLEMAKDDAPLLKLNAELEQRDAKLAAQQDLIEKMGRRLEQLEAQAAQLGAVAHSVAEPEPVNGEEVFHVEHSDPIVTAPEPEPVLSPTLDTAIKRRRRRRRNTAPAVAAKD
jgi:hypothetical protein